MTLAGTSEKQSKRAESYVKLKSLSEKIHRQICHASRAKRYEETLKVIILVTTINLTKIVNSLTVSLVVLIK